MTRSIAEHFIGKEVWIYPGDTISKRGIVKEVDDTGILIEITFDNSGNYSHSSSYVVGKTRYMPLNKVTLQEY